jgi:hypothetical protein
MPAPTAKEPTVKIAPAYLAAIQTALSDPDRQMTDAEWEAREAAEAGMTRNDHSAFTAQQWADHSATGSYEPWPGAYAWHAENPQDGSEPYSEWLTRHDDTVNPLGQEAS